MRKKVIIGVMIIGMAMICGCAKNEPEKTPVNINVQEVNDETKEDAKEVEEVVIADAKTIAESLRNDIEYKDQLNEMDLDTAAMFYNFSDIDIEEAYIYESSGATAEEIVVIKCKDKDSASKLKQIFEARVAEQIESYESYVPEEVPKLKEAVIVVNGDIAALSVSNDAAKAKAILK